MKPEKLTQLVALLLVAACATPELGPRRTTLPTDGAAVLPSRHVRGAFLLFAEFPGLAGRHVLLLDTGTDKTLLDLQFGRSLGLRSLGDEPVVTATGTAVLVLVARLIVVIMVELVEMEQLHLYQELQ